MPTGGSRQTSDTVFVMGAKTGGTGGKETLGRGRKHLPASSGFIPLQALWRAGLRESHGGGGIQLAQQAELANPGTDVPVRWGAPQRSSPCRFQDPPETRFYRSRLAEQPGFNKLSDEGLGLALCRTLPA